MNKLITSTVWRAIRGAVAVWLSTQVANNVWFVPIILAAGKALREKFPGKLTDLLPI